MSIVLKIVTKICIQAIGSKQNVCKKNNQGNANGPAIINGNYFSRQRKKKKIILFYCRVTLYLCHWVCECVYERVCCVVKWIDESFFLFCFIRLGVLLVYSYISEIFELFIYVFMEKRWLKKWLKWGRKKDRKQEDYFMVKSINWVRYQANGIGSSISNDTKNFF